MKRSLLMAFCITAFFLSASDIKLSDEYLNGKRIYSETCVSCHGANGGTNVDIKLTVKPRKLNQSILTQAQMVKMISEGARKWGAHSDIMPGFKYVYDEDQIEAIALYVTTAFNSHRKEKVAKLLKEATPQTLDKTKALKMGKKIFKRNCSLCHGVTGNGESVYVEQSKVNQQFLYPYDLTKIFLTEEQIFLYAKFGGHYWGTEKEDMPSWKKKYNDSKLKAVAKYIHEKIQKSSD